TPCRHGRPERPERSDELRPCPRASVSQRRGARRGHPGRGMVSVAAVMVRGSMLARSLVHHMLAGAAAADVTALILVDVVSWRRTRSLRTGHPPPRAGPWRSGACAASV